MLWYILILIMVVFAAIPLVNILQWKLRFSPSTQKILTIAHRGAGGLAPENTLEAIEQGLQYNVDYIEIDIRQTLDNQIVVIHDKSIDRTSTGSGLVHKMNYFDIEQYNASKSLPGYLDRTKIPLLTEVLAKIIDTGSRLMIEIKDPELYPGMVEKLEQVIQQHHAEDRVVIFSFSQKVISAVQKHLPRVSTGILYVGYEKIDHSLHSQVVAPCWLLVLFFPAIVRKLHEKGYKVFVWTVDAPFFMQYLISKNVDGIITNRPDKLNNSVSN